MHRILQLGEWIDNNRAKALVGSVLVGLAVCFLLIIGYFATCQSAVGYWERDFCAPIRANPPWEVLIGVVIGLPLLLKLCLTIRTATDPNRALRVEIKKYRANVESLHATLPVAGFKTKLRVPIDLADLYVPLRAMVDTRAAGDARFADAEDAEQKLRESGGAYELELTRAFVEAEKRKRKGLVILGDPGSGKTTHLKRLLLFCLREGPGSLGLDKDMLPVFLPLRELSDLNQGLDAFIQDELDKPHLNTQPGFGKRLLERGNLLFLLDGLDEVASVENREKVSRWIEAAVSAHRFCRFVVTSRFAGYTKSVGLNAAFLELHLRPLSAQQASKFVHNWYRIVETGTKPDNPAQGAIIAKTKADALVDRLNQPDFRARRVFELTRNPLLLTNICLVHYDRGQLPNRRADLYDECIDVLLERWRGAKGLRSIEAETGRRVLQPAAYWLHNEDNRTRATEQELVDLIDPVLKSMKYEGGDSRQFIRAVRDESGLLTGWGEDIYGFMHLGFQEYLAAQEIWRRYFTERDNEILQLLASRFGDSWWQEVTLLLMALKSPPFDPFMREVIKGEAFVKNRDLVDMCIDDARELKLAPFVELIRQPAGDNPEHWARQLAAVRILDRTRSSELDALQEELASHPSPELRAWLSGRVLATEQNVIHAERGGYELVLIPGGVFAMGSPESEQDRYNDEGPVHQVDVPSFYLGRYPVTNEQYGRFLAENPGTREPEYWANREYNQPQQPVVGVSWEEAHRYAEWAGLRLPSEAEWEYACRAGTQTRYYSGDSESDLDRVGWYEKNSNDKLHPVGEKESNGYGLYDMHGNVWEWVEDDWHGDYGGAPTDGSAWIEKPRGVSRVIRGGSWISTASYARSACRNANRVGDRYFILGFRLSRSYP